jgi:hypothetical protein
VNKGGLTAALAGFALVVTGVLPPLVLEHTYGDVAVPGSATVHLPSGEVDVTMQAAAPTDGGGAATIDAHFRTRWNPPALPPRIGRAEVASQTVGESVNRARKFGPQTFSHSLRC